MRIGFDLDGVIVDSIGHWIRVFNRELQAGYGPGALPDTHGSPERTVISDRHELEMLIAPGPTAGAAEALRQLSGAGHHLVVVTARSPRLQGLTEAWLEYHGIRMNALHFLEGGSKGPVAQQERLDIFVEDAGHNAFSLVSHGVPVLLYDAPYNRDVTHPLIQRCEGWAQVMRALTDHQERLAG